MSAVVCDSGNRAANGLFGHKDEAIPPSLCSGCPSIPPGNVELEEIVRGADQTPFPSHFSFPSQQESPDASGLFDLAEGRFHDPLAFGVGLSPLLGSQFPSHLLFNTESQGNPPSRSRLCFLGVSLLCGGNVC